MESADSGKEVSHHDAQLNGKEVSDRDAHLNQKESYHAAPQPDNSYRHSIASDDEKAQHRQHKSGIGRLILVALVTAIIVGAAVGGGVGSQLNKAREKAASW